MIFMRLSTPHLGTTSPINDHRHPPTCRRQCPAAASVSLRRARSPVALRTPAYSPIFTRSIRRPMIARPEALARVASPGQAQLQIFDLALISIVGIRPQINHMKLNEHTRRLFFYHQACVSHALNFSLFLVFLRCYKIHADLILI
jgi:hypothetical protein